RPLRRGTPTASASALTGAVDLGFTVRPSGALCRRSANGTRNSAGADALPAVGLRGTAGKGDGQALAGLPSHEMRLRLQLHDPVRSSAGHLEARWNGELPGGVPSAPHPAGAAESGLSRRRIIRTKSARFESAGNSQAA